jgi:hypothetical protein
VIFPGHGDGLDDFISVSKQRKGRRIAKGDKSVRKQFQSSQKLLRAAANKCHDLWRTKKTVPVKQPDNFSVARRQLHWRNCGSTFEAGKTG